MESGAGNGYFAGFGRDFNGVPQNRYAEGELFRPPSDSRCSRKTLALTELTRGRHDCCFCLSVNMLRHATWSSCGLPACSDQ